MSHFDDYFDSLKVEALTDMANNFFGTRRDLDDEKDAFAREAAKVRELGERVLDRAALLHALLLEPKAVCAFYRKLGAPCDRLAGMVVPSRARLDRPMPFRLFPRSRYKALLLIAYESTQSAFALYMNGRYYVDPREPRVKRLTMHYGLLKDWCGHINRRVRNVNESLAPSCVLSFAKQLDGDTIRNERIMEATIPDNACELDQSLAMQQVDCLEHGLFELPLLPEPDKARTTVDLFADRLYRRNPRRIRTLLKRLKLRKKLPQTIEAPRSNQPGDATDAED